MAEALTIQGMIDANVDVNTIEQTANEDMIVIARNGREFPSAPRAIRLILEQGTIDAFLFLTKADLDTGNALGSDTPITLVDDDFGLVLNDEILNNNGYYQMRSGELVWLNLNASKQALAEIEQAKQAAINAAATDAQTKANTAKQGAIDTAKTYIEDAVADIATNVLDGSSIFYRTKDEPTKLFTAIWQEYNKPIWYIGNDTIVDVTGVSVSVVREELVFTIKLTAANQTFLYPIRNALNPDINATVDWGDGITTTHTDQNINHTYVGAIGDVFTIRVSGNPLHFDFSAANAARNTSRLMMRSIESNTLPKTMPYFSIQGCTNMVYLGRGALSSYTGTSLAGYFLDLKNLVIHSKVFEGLSQVTNINNLFADAAKPVAIAIPSGVLDPFVNATTAMGMFRGLSTALPLGILDKLVNLQNVSNMFFSATVSSIDNNLFKYQTGLQDVSNTFRLASNAVADAQILYNDMVRGNPTNTTLCFNGASKMTNLASVPSTWK